MFCSLIKAESENVHVVFCPNKECPFEPFMCLDIETLACTCNYTLLFISAEIV